MKEVLCLQRHFPESNSARGKPGPFCKKRESCQIVKLDRWAPEEKDFVVNDMD